MCQQRQGIWLGLPSGQACHKMGLMEPYSCGTAPESLSFSDRSPGFTLSRSPAKVVDELRAFAYSFVRHGSCELYSFGGGMGAGEARPHTPTGEVWRGLRSLHTSP